MNGQLNFRKPFYRDTQEQDALASLNDPAIVSCCPGPQVLMNEGAIRPPYKGISVVSLVTALHETLIANFSLGDGIGVTRRFTVTQLP